MTSDGVDGTAAKGRPSARLRDGSLAPSFIKRDDGRFWALYTEPAYPHTPVGAAPQAPRRERQVAAALHDDGPHFPIASVTRGPAGTAGGHGSLMRRRRAMECR
jgi:hypothetical protein